MRFTAEQVGRIRKDRGLSVAELAHICHVSPRTIEGWEQGRPMGDAASFLLFLFLEAEKAATEEGLA